MQWHFKWAIAGGTWAGRFDPWVGLGTGFESAIVHLETQAGARSHQSYNGLEYGNLQLGADYVAAPMHLGAFAGLSLAEFLGTTQTNPTGSHGYEIPDPALHLWFSLGVRGQYDL